jgi:M6 family metalloprotease-like protein
MKRLFFLMLLALTINMAYSIPARRGLWRTITLSNGKQLRVELRGDEHLHYWTSETGENYQQNTFAQFERVERSALAKQWRERMPKRVATRATARKVSAYKGKKKCLVILVQYSDVTFSIEQPQNTYQRILNEKDYNEGRFVGSVKDYFLEQSNGLLELDFDVAGPVTLPHAMAYYGANDSNGDDMRAGKMVAEACKAVDSEVDFSAYDWDGDGAVEQVYVCYAGLGEASSNESNSVWPHKFTLKDSDYGQSLKLDGVTVDTYSCGNEREANGELSGIGTFCHEFSHGLGLPDLYDMNQENFGLDAWDLMDYGSYNGDGFVPAGYSAFEKMSMGWLTPSELSGEVQVDKLSAMSNGDSHAYIIYNKGYKDEYYLLENRQQTGWDAALPGHGLMITHVDYDADAWELNKVNTTRNTTSGNDHQRCTIFHADNEDGTDVRYNSSGEKTYPSEVHDLYPSNSNDSLGNHSLPAAKLYHANSDGTFFMNCLISGITENSDGTVAFNYRETNSEETMEEGDSIVVFHETFDKCNGAGGNDGYFHGNLGTGDFIPDNEGWVVISYCYYGANKCARFGNSKNMVTRFDTPTFDLESDTTYFSFRIAGWNAKKDKTLLTIKDGNHSLYETFNISKGSWNTYKVKLVGKGKCCVSFYIEGRCFLDDVLAYCKKETTGIVEVKAAPKRQGIYSLSGVYLGNNLDKLKPGIYIVDGKKIMN